MALLRKLKEENVRLPRFENPDIYENIIITGVSGEKRKKNDGSYIDSLFFLKLAQLDMETGAKIREEDFAFWPTKHDKGGDNFAWYASNLATTLLEFLECYYPMEQLEGSFDPFSDFGLNESNYDQDVKKVLGKKQNMDAFNEKIKQLFIAHVQQLIPSQEYNRPIRIKITPSSNGKHLGLADQHWVESMAVEKEKSQIQITNRDRDLTTKWRNLKTGTPAVGGAAPMTAAGSMPNIPGASIPGVNAQGGADQAGIPGVPNNAGNAGAAPQNTPPQNAPAGNAPVNNPVANQASNPVANAGQPSNPNPTNPVANAGPVANPNAGQPLNGFGNGNGSAPTGAPQGGQPAAGSPEMPQIDFNKDPNKPF